MTKDGEAIQAGRDAASTLLTTIQAAENGCTSDRARLLWWAGFFACIGGYAAASIGPGAVDAVACMTAEATEKVLRRTAH